MKKKLIGIVTVAALLGGCGSIERSLGNIKSAPDEFAVYTRAPLTMPPDYGLRPPTPGDKRKARSLPREEAKRALIGARGQRPVASAAGQQPFAGASGQRPVPAKVSLKSDPSMSTGLYALLRDTGGLKADPKIRSIVNKETTMLADTETGLARKILNWARPVEYGAALNPDEESKRIRENQALGRPITERPKITRATSDSEEDFFTKKWWQFF